MARSVLASPPAGTLIYAAQVYCPFWFGDGDGDGGFRPICCVLQSVLAFASFLLCAFLLRLILFIFQISSSRFRWAAHAEADQGKSLNLFEAGTYEVVRKMISSSLPRTHTHTLFRDGSRVWMIVCVCFSFGRRIGP